MTDMEKMEGLAEALIEAMQKVGGSVESLDDALTGKIGQFDSKTRIDKLTIALKDCADELHTRNERMQRYTQAMEDHTKALENNTAAMDNYIRAMEDRGQAMPRTRY